MSASPDDVQNEKKKIICHACGTPSFIRIGRLPEHVREVTCAHCGEPIPLLERLTGSTKSPSGEPAASPSDTADAHGSWDMLAYPSSHSQDAEESEDDSGWLISFSDVMTQLLAFFILLAAMSTIDRHKFDVAMAAISQSLGGRPVSSAHLPDAAGVAVIDPGKDMLGYLRSLLKTEQGSMDQLRNTLKELVDQQRLGDEIAFHNDSDGLVIILQSAVLFDEGKADIRGELRGVLLEMGRLLAPLSNEIVVEGHTDNKPISNRQYPSNWELSMQRAINVVKLYTEEEAILDPHRVVASGVASYRPRYNVNSEEGYRNRRIEIHIRRDSSNIFDRLLHSH